MKNKIEKVLNAVVSMSVQNTGDSGSGACCPFCLKDCRWDAGQVSEIEHEEGCIVLTANELMHEFNSVDNNHTEYGFVEGRQPFPFEMDSIGKFESPVSVENIIESIPYPTITQKLHYQNFTESKNWSLNNMETKRVANVIIQAAEYGAANQREVYKPLIKIFLDIINPIAESSDVFRKSLNLRIKEFADSITKHPYEKVENVAIEKISKEHSDKGKCVRFVLSNGFDFISYDSFTEKIWNHCENHPLNSIGLNLEYKEGSQVQITSYLITENSGSTKVVKNTNIVYEL